MKEIEMTENKVKKEKKSKKEKRKEKKVRKKKEKVVLTKAEKHARTLDRLKCTLFIVVGCAMYSLSIAWFLAPQNTPNGGVSGVAIILNHLFPSFALAGEGGAGLWIFLINIPLLILAICKLGTRFSLLTVVCVFLTSAFTELFQRTAGYISLISGIEPLPAVIIGGMLSGLALGIVFRARTCVGGSDIIVKVLRLKYKYIKTGTFYLIVDGLVVCAGGLIFQNINSLVYGIIALFIQSQMTDLLLYGQDGAKMIYIITDKEPSIASRINEEIHCGVTYLKGTGAYTGNEKMVVMCAIRKQSLPKAKEIVLQEDPNAFMIVTSATQVWGKGYKGLDEKEL